VNATAARSYAAPSELGGIVDALLAGLTSHAPGASATGSDETRFVVVPAPLLPAERAVAAIDDDGIAMLHPDGDASVGLERAFEVPAGSRGDGHDGSLARLREALAQKLEPLRAVGRGAGVVPFAIGALAFDGREPLSAPFAELGGGAFVVPRVAYVIRGGKAFVVATARPSERARVAQLASRLVRRLDEPVAPSATQVASIVDSDAARFGESVAAANAAIARGALHKVVLARRMVLTLDAPVEIPSLVYALGIRAPATHRFVLVRGSSAFVGATPERLVSCRGGRVSTVALAGTMRSGATTELFASLKDRAEHRWVVDAIRSALEPLCEGPISIDAEPRARELRDLVHLETAIEGRLRGGCDVFDVIAQLHPTPAVGGTPREAALAHIADAEPFERGFYAAPFGVVDADGDAEIVVALRSGVFRDREAYLFAGSGIVLGSVPDNELAETDLKLRALLGALGDE
jgi:salicylate biosynthesis isochorismate synthase